MEKEPAFEGVRIGRAEFGLGVFATREFSGNETIGRVFGRLVFDPDHGSEYCIALTDYHSLEPSAPFRYLNHSCDPNCILTQVDVEDEEGRFVEAEIWVETVRDIKPGEQMTIDYAWPAEVAIRCGCGSVNCRGWIVDECQLHRLPATSGAAADESASAA